MLPLELSSDSWVSAIPRGPTSYMEWQERHKAVQNSNQFMSEPKTLLRVTFVVLPTTAPAAGQEPRVGTRKDSDRLLSLRNDVQPAARTLETNRIACTTVSDTSGDVVRTLRIGPVPQF